MLCISVACIPPCVQIIPIEGDFDYNDEPQSTFSEVLTEMVVIRCSTVHEYQGGWVVSTAVSSMCASPAAREVGLLGEQGSKENNLTHFTEGFMKIERFAQQVMHARTMGHVQHITCSVCDRRCELRSCMHAGCAHTGEGLQQALAVLVHIG